MVRPIAKPRYPGTPAACSVAIVWRVSAGRASTTKASAPPAAFTWCASPGTSSSKRNLRPRAWSQSDRTLSPSIERRLSATSPSGLNRTRTFENVGRVGQSALGERAGEPVEDHRLGVGDGCRLLRRGRTVESEHLLGQRSAPVQREHEETAFVAEGHGGPTPGPRCDTTPTRSIRCARGAPIRVDSVPRPGFAEGGTYAGGSPRASGCPSPRAENRRSDAIRDASEGA